MKQTRIQRLCECAVLLGLAVALSYVVIWRMPLEGSVTLLSMLPICIVSCRHGIKWGLGIGFCHAWFQVLQGNPFGWGLTPTLLVGTLLLDYLIPFTCIGLGGLFRKKGFWGVIGGISFACCLRFLSHFLSGVLIFAKFDQFVVFGEAFFNRPVLYSILYNGFYMLPELILMLTGTILLLRVPATRRLLLPSEN